MRARTRSARARTEGNKRLKLTPKECAGSARARSARKRRTQIPKRKQSFRVGALALSAIRRYEKAAVRAFETPVTFRLAGHQFGRERLLAVRAHDLVRRLLGGDLGHVATLPACSVLGQKEPVIRQRRSLGCWRIAARRPEVDQAEEPLAVRQADRVTPGLGAKHPWCSPVAREPARVRCEQNGVDRARGRADVLLILLEVAAECRGGDDERRCTLELWSFCRPGGPLQARHRLRAKNAKAPGVRPVVVRRPARELEQLVDRLARNRVGSERLVRPPCADGLLEIHAPETRRNAALPRSAGARGSRPSCRPDRRAVAAPRASRDRTRARTGESSGSERRLRHPRARLR